MANQTISRDVNHYDDTEDLELSMSYDTEKIDVPLDVYKLFFVAWAYFNTSFFGGRLPPCLITFQRKRGVYGYFYGERFESITNSNQILDEIAINPEFLTRGSAVALSTLLHEMVHAEQYHFGKGSRGRYHNRAWANRMVELGLPPSSTGKPGGSATGNWVSHYVRENGPFDLACKEFLAGEQATIFHDHAPKAFSEKQEKRRRKQAASKTKYTCCGCGHNAWSKPGTFFICGPCNERFEPAGEDLFAEPELLPT